VAHLVGRLDAVDATTLGVLDTPRRHTQLHVVTPQPAPIPVSVEASGAVWRGRPGCWQRSHLRRSGVTTTAATYDADVLVVALGADYDLASLASRFVEMGAGEVGRVDVHFRAKGGPTAPLLGPSAAYAVEKAEFGAVRQARWFDL